MSLPAPYPAGVPLRLFVRTSFSGRPDEKMARVENRTSTLNTSTSCSLSTPGTGDLKLALEIEILSSIPVKEMNL